MLKKKFVNILGINLDNLSRTDLLAEIPKILAGNRFCFLTTPNPEIILEALKDEEYFYVLNEADYSIPDAIGIKLAALACGKWMNRITGADLSFDLLSIAEKASQKVLVINWLEGLSEKAEIENMLKEKFSRLDFLVLSASREKTEWLDLDYESIRKFDPKLLFCLLGAPYQEKFIYHCASRIPSLKLAIGVGGAFDFLTGKIRRAPRLLRIAGLEWMWRLIKQPSRIRRIYSAVIVFPLKFLRWRFILPWLYRPNVACLLYKEIGGCRSVLLVERRDESGHWQIPQGGTDGENPETAGARELNEELNCGKFDRIKTYPDVFRFRFGQSHESAENIERAQKHLGYKGQKQSLFIAKFTGADADIKLNFWDHSAWKWVPENEAVAAVHVCRREAMGKFMELLKKTC